MDGDENEDYGCVHAEIIWHITWHLFLSTEFLATPDIIL